MGRTSRIDLLRLFSLNGRDAPQTWHVNARVIRSANDNYRARCGGAESGGVNQQAIRLVGLELWSG